MIILFVELDLFLTELFLPTLSLWGVVVLHGFIGVAGYCMHTFQVNSLKKRLYDQVGRSKLSDRIGNKISKYGLSVLGVGVLISLLSRGSFADFSLMLQVWAAILMWIILDLSAIATVIFVGYPYFLHGYYKLKHFGRIP